MNSNNSPNQVVIFGATSEVAQHVLRLHAEQSDQILLVARNEERLKIVAHDAATRGAEIVDTICTDLGNTAEMEPLMQKLCNRLNRKTDWYFFQGELPDQQAAQTDWLTTQSALDTNFTCIAAALHYIANHIEHHQGGTVVVITSVAGLRGRQSNYIYGTGKGALNIYLQGLRNRLHKSNGQVITVMPGFIKTAMTAGMKREGFLWATPDRVANDIYKAVQNRRDICYTPWFWRYIMLIIQHIPETIFKRLNL